MTQETINKLLDQRAVCVKCICDLNTNKRSEAYEADKEKYQMLLEEIEKIDQIIHQ